MKTNEIKKGQTIFEIQPYNFSEYSNRTNEVDIWDVKERIVTGCGKKRITMVDSKNVNAKYSLLVRDNEVVGYPVFETKEQAELYINEIRASNPKSNVQFEIRFK